VKTELYPISVMGWMENDGRRRYAVYCAIGLPRIRKGKGTIEIEFLWWTGRKWSTEQSKRKVVNNLESAAEIGATLRVTMRHAMLEIEA